MAGFFGSRRRWVARHWGVVWVSLLLSAITVALGLASPHFVDAEGRGVSVVGQSDLRALRVGTREMELDELFVLEEPDVLESWEEYDRFRSLQGRASEALGSEHSLVLVYRDGTSQRLERAPRALFALGGKFWLLIFTALFCAASAEITWKLGRRSAGLVGYRLAGWGVAFAAWASSLYAVRSIAIAPAWLEGSHAVNTVLGGPLFGAGLCMLLAAEPRRLGPPPWLWLAGVPVTLVLWLGRFAPGGPAFAGYAAIFAYTAAIPVLLVVQWWRLESPVERAVWRWQTLAVLAGIGFFVLAQAVPIALHVPPLANQATTLLGFGLLFALMSLGATRYRLFSVARHWGRTWFWLGTAAAVLALDVLLAAVLPLAWGDASRVTVVLAAWLYFPVRQYVLGRMRARRRLDLSQVIAELSRSEGESDLLARFEACLTRHYSPANVETIEAIADVALAADGSTLAVPWPSGAGAFRLTFKDGGSALFDVDDVAQARSLVDLARTLLGAWAAYARGEDHERKRLRRDLHDHLGARLSRLEAIARDSSVAHEIHALAGELRGLTDALSGEPTPGALVLLELEAEARSLARAHELRLIFETEGSAELLYVSPSRRGDLLAFVREALHNAARHGDHGEPVCVVLSALRGRIRMTSTNGVTQPIDPLTISAAASSRSQGSRRGLWNLECRARLASGSFEAVRRGKVFRLLIELPLLETEAERMDERARAATWTPQVYLG